MIYDPMLDFDAWNLHVEPNSLGWNSGDPALQDDDGSVSDMGATGGPKGDQGSYFQTSDDTLPDGWELQYFGSIDLWADGDDPDGDGVNNFDELTLSFTNPSVDDTDGDGVNDLADGFPTDPGLF